MTRLLVVDDDPHRRLELLDAARKASFEAFAASSGAEALELLAGTPGITAILLDLVMPELDGMAVLERLARLDARVPVIVVSPDEEPARIASAMHAGAADFCLAPVSAARLGVTVANAIRLADTHRALGRAGSDPVTLQDYVSSNPAMLRAIDQARKAARSPLPVLIEGEAGTGKLDLARAIHLGSERAGKPFVALDCGATSPAETEARLFGGNDGDLGAVVSARGGTLFLSDVGALSAGSQARLNLLLAEGKWQPAGSKRTVPANLRVIASTRQRLLNLASAGVVRQDLFYRLNVMPVYLPPLRDRREDLERIAAAMLSAIAVASGRYVPALSEAALATLGRHDWPGNLRELRATLAQAIAISRSDRLGPEDFPALLVRAEGIESARNRFVSTRSGATPVHIDTLSPAGARSHPEAARDRFLDDNGDLRSLAEVERDLIAFALDRCKGRMARVARLLGIGRSTLYRKLKDHGIAENAQSRAA